MGALVIGKETNTGEGGGGKLVRAYVGKVTFGEGEFGYKILGTMGKCGTIFP